MKLSCNTIISVLILFAAAPAVEGARRGFWNRYSPDRPEEINGMKCFTGRAPDVKAACDKLEDPEARCCQTSEGVNSCGWPGFMQVTVCEGGCKGADACMNIRSPMLIEPNSCVGDHACAGAHIRGSSFRGSLTNVIGMNSCVGDYACANGFFMSVMGAEAIGNDSCVGPHACEGFRGNVGNGACVVREEDETGGGACSKLGGFYVVGDCVAEIEATGNHHFWGFRRVNEVEQDYDEDEGKCVPSDCGLCIADKGEENCFEFCGMSMSRRRFF